MNKIYNEACARVKLIQAYTRMDEIMELIEDPDCENEDELRAEYEQVEEAMLELEYLLML